MIISTERPRIAISWAKFLWRRLLEGIIRIEIRFCHLLASWRFLNHKNNYQVSARRKKRSMGKELGLPWTLWIRLRICLVNPMAVITQISRSTKLIKVRSFRGIRNIMAKLRTAWLSIILTIIHFCKTTTKKIATTKALAYITISPCLKAFKIYLQVWPGNS